MNITPDYTLIQAVEMLSDGAEVHQIAQELNIYVLAVRGLNERPSEQDRLAYEVVRKTAEIKLRKFVVRKRLSRI